MGAAVGVKAIAIVGVIAEAVNKGILRGQPVFKRLSKANLFLSMTCNLHLGHGSGSPKLLDSDDS